MRRRDWLRFSTRTFCLAFAGSTFQSIEANQVAGGKSSLAEGTVVPVIQASYNATTGAVLLTPAIPLPASELFEVGVNGMGPTAVSDLAGNALNSVYGEVTGSDYILEVARGTTLNYTDQNGTAVTLKLTGPGTLDIDRTLGGELGRLQVVGGVAGKTVVSGSVHGSGKRTTIGTILGLGSFGDIPLELTTPPFTVSTVVYPASQALTDTPAVDTLLSSAVPAPTTTKPVKVTRKGKSTPVVSTASKTTPIKAEAILDPTPVAAEQAESVGATKQAKTSIKVKTAVKHPVATFTKTVRERSRR